MIGEITIGSPGSIWNGFVKKGVWMILGFAMLWRSIWAGKFNASAKFYKMNERYEKGTWRECLGLILRAVMLGWWIDQNCRTVFNSKFDLNFGFLATDDRLPKFLA
jgi:hypothetical protein